MNATNEDKRRKGITLIKITKNNNGMIDCFPFDLSDIRPQLKQGRYCETNPTSSGVQLGCPMTNTPSGGAL